MRNDAGLTLIELMVVIGILAILASIAIPSFIGWLPNYRLRSAADEVQSILQNARLRAVRENAIVSVIFDVNNESYLAFLDNGAGANAGNRIQNSDELTVKSGQMPSGIDLDTADFGGWAVVQFDRRGFPIFAGNVVVANGTRSETITLTLGGNASI